MIDRSAFEGKTVLLTGDTGFKGSWLALWLESLGAETVGFALPAERDRDLFNLGCISELIRHVDGDIRDEGAIGQVVDETQPEIIFHLAAQSLVRRSYREPKRTFDTNVGGFVNVLEAACHCSSVRAVIMVTSDKCYRNKEWVWGYRENDELGGPDPYSASKAAAEHVFEAYRRSFLVDDGPAGATVRAGNVIGGGDRSEDRIVPDCVAALEAGQPVTIRNPHATRPWQHVLEPLSGYLTLAAGLMQDPGTYSGSWNFGPRGDSMRTVGDLAKEVVDRWGSGTVELQEEDRAPHEAGLLHLNCDKALAELSWKPKWDFVQAVARTVDWYRRVGDGASARDETRRQIAEYMEAEE